MFQNWYDKIVAKFGETDYKPKIGPTNYLDQEQEMPEGHAFIAGTSEDGRKFIMFEIQEESKQEITTIPCVLHQRYFNDDSLYVMAFFGFYNFPNGGDPTISERTVGGKNISKIIQGKNVIFVRKNNAKIFSLTKEGKNYWFEDEQTNVIKSLQAEIKRLSKEVRKYRLKYEREKASNLKVDTKTEKQQLSWPPSDKYFHSLAEAGFSHLEKKNSEVAAENITTCVTVLTYFKNDPDLIIFNPKFYANTKYITREFFNKDKTLSVVTMVGEID